MDRIDELKKINSIIKQCTKCRLAKTRGNAVPGEGPLDAKAGNFLDKLMEKNGIDRKKAFVTSAVKCMTPENRLPKDDEVKTCLPFTLNQIKLVQPEIIVLLGRVAMKAFTPFTDLDDHHGKMIKVEEKQYFLTYHPASGMRFPEIKKKMEKDFKNLKEF
jgi:DNA polymerase